MVMSIIGKTIVCEEIWEDDSNDYPTIYHFLTTTDGQVFHILIHDIYDWYNPNRFKLITMEEKNEILKSHTLKLGTNTTELVTQTPSPPQHLNFSQPTQPNRKCL